MFGRLHQEKWPADHDKHDHHDKVQGTGVRPALLGMLTTREIRDLLAKGKTDSPKHSSFLSPLIFPADIKQAIPRGVKVGHT